MDKDDDLASGLVKLGQHLTFIGTGGNQFLLGWRGGERPTVQILNEEVHALAAAGFDIQ